MANQIPKLNRQQLAKVFQDFEVLRSFELLFDYVAAAAPEAFELASVSTASQTSSSVISVLESRIADLERSNLSLRAKAYRALDRIDDISKFLKV
jgi:hypothetical protein